MQEYTIAELQGKMKSGELTARQLTQSYLERIESVDRAGAGLNSIIESNPEALAIASALDVERAAGRTRGPLHGIPVVIKDNIDTADKMQTTAGSIALEGNYAAQDAGLVEKLRAAGAVILAKTNLSEWANFRGQRSSSGWSSRGGLTLNPYALDRSACGSSSGTGAAIAANLAAVGVGTETDGSIICPAQTNGLVGIKPTLGLVSRSGIIPISHSQDTAGPMTRNVTDAAILLSVLRGLDKRDPATRAVAKRGVDDYSKSLNPRGLKGARIGVARTLFGTDSRVAKIMEESLDAMKQAGATLIDVELKSSNTFGKAELEILYYEFKAGLDAYLRGVAPHVKIHSMADTIKFNEEHAATVLKYFGQEHMLAAQERGPLTSKKYLAALVKSKRLSQKEGIDAVMRKHRLQAITLPSGGPSWKIDLVNGDASNWDNDSTSYAAAAGYPHITVPAGYLFGLPVGVSFMAKAWQEATIIKFAYAFEQLTKVRKPPQFLPSANL